MDHILFDCKNAGCSEVWCLTKALWRTKGGDWPAPRWTSDALAATLADLKTPAGRRRPGATRLYKVLMTESVFLIWKLQNERVIGPIDPETGQHTQGEIRNRWMSAINMRLKLDIVMTRTW